MMRRFLAWLKGERAKPLRDVGGIVLGVLIALGIGEIADDIRWRFKVRDSEAAMRTELGTMRRILNERLAMADCIDARLDAIRGALLDARGGKPLTAIGTLAAPPYRLIDGTAFDVARDEGVSLHMAPAKWRMYAETYSLTAGLYRGFSEPERARWDTLQLLEDTTGTVEPGLLSTLLIAATEAQAYARRQRGLAMQGDHAIDILGIPIDWNFDAPPDGPGTLADQRARAARSAVCRPLAIETVR